MKSVLTLNILVAAALLAGTAACSPDQLALLNAAATPAGGDMSQNSDNVNAGGNVGSGAVNANGSSSPVGTLYPVDGASACQRPQVGVDLLLTDAMRKDGTFDPSTIALSLDGQDITQGATMRQSLTSPASRVSILFTPASDLPLGKHGAQLTYPSSTGSATVTWGFTVVNMPCGE